MEPPLVPTPDEGRELLRRELLDRVYHQDDLLRRLLNWLTRRLNDALVAASAAPPLSVFAAMAIGLVLVLALLWLLSRARTSPRARTAVDAILPDDTIPASAWRARARQALAEGRHSDALLDGFRALVADQVERGRLDAAPGLTAHEVAQVLRTAHPSRAEDMSEGARLFDLVLYGDREASQQQAEFVLALDDELAGVR